MDALYAALDALKVHIEGQSLKSVSGASVILVSNLSGLEDEGMVMNHVAPLASGFSALDIDLLIVLRIFAFLGRKSLKLQWP